MTLNNKHDNNRIGNANNVVNHPNHYQNLMINGENIETIKLIDSELDMLGFSSKVSHKIGDALKYINRAPFKHPEKPYEDIRKAAWYLSYAADLLEDEYKKK